MRYDFCGHDIYPSISSSWKIVLFVISPVSLLIISLVSCPYLQGHGEPTAVPCVFWEAVSGGSWAGGVWRQGSGLRWTGCTAQPAGQLRTGHLLSGASAGHRSWHPWQTTGGRCQLRFGCCVSSYGRVWDCPAMPPKWPGDCRGNGQPCAPGPRLRELGPYLRVAWKLWASCRVPGTAPKCGGSD